MNNLFIECNDHPLLADLAACHQTVFRARAIVDGLVAQLKQCRGERIGKDLSRDLNDPLTRERERAYEVAAIRVELANRELLASTTALHEIIGAVESALEAQIWEQKEFDLVTYSVAQNNVVCALELANEAAATYYNTEQKQLSEFRHHYFGIDRTFKARGTVADDLREFVIMASGHGSSFRFDGPDGKVTPAAPYMTLSEARQAVWHWVGIADTIGGRAQVYNVRTKEVQESTEESLRAARAFRTASTEPKTCNDAAGETLSFPAGGNSNGQPQIG